MAAPGGRAAAAAALRLLGPARGSPPPRAHHPRGLAAAAAVRVVQGWDKRLGTEVVESEAGTLRVARRPAAGPPAGGGPRREGPPAWLRGASEQLAATFLPRGYPDTVAPGYLPYVKWQWVHHCAGSAHGVLASSFLLYAVGLTAGAIPTAGALNWVLKDGLGQLGTLVFGKYLGHRFDMSAKGWYLAASAKLNLGIAMEIASFAQPGLFLPLASGANMVKGLAWMCGGSTRSAFNVSFARANNIADVTAKATSQTISSFVVGNSLGMGLASAVGQDVALAYAAFGLCTALHLGSAWRCLAHVPLATLNQSRLQLLAREYAASGAVGPPEALAAADPVLHLQPHVPADLEPRVRVGERLAGPRGPLLGGRALEALVAAHRRERYLLWRGADGFHVLFHRDADVAAVAQAFLHAELLHRDPGFAARDAAGQLACAREAAGGFLRGVEAAGWKVDQTLVDDAASRAVWEVTGGADARERKEGGS